MLLLTLAALQAAAPTNAPDPNLQPVMAYFTCVIVKAKEFAKSTEEAKVVVDTAVGACSSHRPLVRAAIARHVDASAPDAPARMKLKTIDDLAADTDEKARNWGYQAVIKVRTPE